MYMYRPTKTRLYDFDPLKPHLYICKAGVYRGNIIFLISAQKHRLWVLGGSEQKLQNIRVDLSENFHFLVVKFLVYLNRHVFVMNFPQYSKIPLLRPRLGLSQSGRISGVVLILTIEYGKCPKMSNTFISYISGLNFTFYAVVSLNT